MSGSDDIRHEPERRRFAAGQGEGLAVLDYRRVGEGTLDYRHTFVPPALRGGGLATRLVRFALDHARDEGLKVVPSCPFVARLIDRYPEYRALLADEAS